MGRLIKVPAGQPLNIGGGLFFQLQTSCGCNGDSYGEHLEIKNVYFALTDHDDCRT